MKKILVVFGTRPEAIKMAPLVKALIAKKDYFNTSVCVTAQHREMLDMVLRFFEIHPDYDFDIMRSDQDLFNITSDILIKMRRILNECKPALVLVHGDTTTSMTAALASFYLQIPVAHVEAGLRTNNRYSPWPEELNRQITGRIATYHLSPTERSKINLLKENISEKNIFVTGNTVVDALHHVLEKISKSEDMTQQCKKILNEAGYDCNRLTENKKMILITAHRRENFGVGFKNICNAINMLAKKYDDVDFVYPMHLNPNVREPVVNLLSGNSVNNNIYLLDHLEYLPFVFLMSKSYLVLTDSGGIQEEAPAIGKPVLVLRNTTERTEALAANTVRLLGTEQGSIEKGVSLLLEDKRVYKLMSCAVNPYGDGRASEKIVNFLINAVFNDS